MADYHTLTPVKEFLKADSGPAARSAIQAAHAKALTVYLTSGFGAREALWGVSSEDEAAHSLWVDYGGVTGARAIECATTISAFSGLFAGHKGTHDPYAMLSVGNADPTRTGGEVFTTGAGIAAFRLARSGGTAAAWEWQVPSGSATFDLCNVPAGMSPVAHMRVSPATGNVDVLTANASLAADILTPRKGVTFRTGVGWPAAGDIPAGTACVWKNTTAGTIRHCANDGGAIRMSADWT